MKNIKLLSLLSVAAFVLTGCNKKCSKEEFMDLVNKTEPHQYAKAYAKCKGKVSSKTEGINQSYEPTIDPAQCWQIQFGIKYIFN